MRKLKVYGGNLDGVHRVILATTSYTAFCKATHVSRNMSCETGNAIEYGTAMNKPGTIFVRIDDYRHPFEPLRANPLEWAEVRAYDKFTRRQGAK